MTILTEKERRLLFGTLFGTPSAKQSSPPLWRKALAILVIGLPIIGIVLWGETLQHHQYPSLSPLSPFEIGGAIGGSRQIPPCGFPAVGSRRRSNAIEGKELGCRCHRSFRSDSRALLRPHDRRYST